MGFTCPICKKRKDGKKKKSNLSCVDCYDEACGKKTRRSELKEWKESVRKRDEELVAAADEMRRNKNKSGKMRKRPGNSSKRLRGWKLS